MSTNENANLTSVFFKNVRQHFVSLRGVDKTPNDTADLNEGMGVPFNYSCFVIAIGQDWFLITAGHVLEKIAKARESGKIIEQLSLDDAYSPDATFKKSGALIPFDYDNAPKHVIDKAEVGDYAAIYLRPLYCDLLSKNGISPLTPSDMSVYNHDTEFETYYIVGLPYELMSTTIEGETLKHRSQIVSINAQCLAFDALPTSVKERIRAEGYRTDNLFARIPDAAELKSGEEGLKSIVGVSGGPIFGLYKMPDGMLSYVLVAVQSTWWPIQRVIMACPITRLVDALHHAIQVMDAKISLLTPAIDET